eukprot:scaffold1066_cov309-Pinguiococcus_pyrenoidosus.AAC.2
MLCDALHRYRTSVGGYSHFHVELLMDLGQIPAVLVLLLPVGIPDSVLDQLVNGICWQAKASASHPKGS